MPMLFPQRLEWFVLALGVSVSFPVSAPGLQWLNQGPVPTAQRRQLANFSTGHLLRLLADDSIFGDRRRGYSTNYTVAVEQELIRRRPYRELFEALRRSEERAEVESYLQRERDGARFSFQDILSEELPLDRDEAAEPKKP